MFHKQRILINIRNIFRETWLTNFVLFHIKCIDFFLLVDVGFFSSSFSFLTWTCLQIICFSFFFVSNCCFASYIFFFAIFRYILLTVIFLFFLSHPNQPISFSFGSQLFLKTQPTTIDLFSFYVNEKRSHSIRNYCEKCILGTALACLNLTCCGQSTTTTTHTHTNTRQDDTNSPWPQSFQLNRRATFGSFRECHITILLLHPFTPIRHMIGLHHCTIRIA